MTINTDNINITKLPSTGDIDPETKKAYTKSKLKKMKKIFEAQKKRRENQTKQAEKILKDKAEAELRKKEKLGKGNFVVLNPSEEILKAPKIKTIDAFSNIGRTVKVSGWVDKITPHGGLMFIHLRDCSDFKNRLQCVLSGEILKTKEALELSRECSVVLYGTIKEDKRAEGGVELSVEHWELIGTSSNNFSNIVDDETNPSIAMDQRHLFLRKNVSMQIFRMRSIIINAFRKSLFEKDFTEVTTPTLVQTQVEGGSTLFNVDYFGSTAFLTQSSQLYLETCIFSLGNVFAIVPSYRAEKTRTRRHVCEYTHLESEMPFIQFDDLLDHIENLVVSVCQTVLKSDSEILRELNPDFKIPDRPFKRMLHSEAIDFCRENGIYKNEETKEHFEYGDDIPEGPERKMTDMINRPIFLTNFPTRMKPFYMKKCADKTLTESVDLLIPGVGEIVGGSMREDNYEELMAGFEEKKLETDNYYWYTDLRKYGSVPHGGYGLGIERFLCWMLKRDHIRDVCLYPRFTNRCKP